jgi:hypothetical protein
MLATVCKLRGAVAVVAVVVVVAADAVAALGVAAAAVVAAVAVAAASSGAVAVSANGSAHPDHVEMCYVMAGFDQVDPAISCPLCGARHCLALELPRFSTEQGFTGSQKMLARGLDGIPGADTSCAATPLKG